MFTPKWASVDEEVKQEFLSNHNNLSELSDKELRKYIENIGAKSDWDRFFKDKISLTSINNDIDFIRRQRNKVAHSKFFTYDEYAESIRILKKLTKVVNDAINITQDKDFMKTDLENIKVSLQNIADAFGNFNVDFLDTFLTTTKQAIARISEALAPICESYYSIHSIVNEIVQSDESPE